MNAHLCSWDQRSGYWIVVNVGPEAKMRERMAVMYDTARKVGMVGAAFIVTTGDVPSWPPLRLAVEMVGVTPPPTRPDAGDDRWLPDRAQLQDVYRRGVLVAEDLETWEPQGLESAVRFILTGERD